MNRTIKKYLKILYYLPSTSINKIQYFFKHVKVGNNHETKGILFIRNGGRIIIGDGVRINSKASANPIGNGNRTWIQILNNGELIIGNNTGISNCAITVAQKVTIGNYVRIGSGAHIYDTDFHAIDPFERINGSTGVKNNPINIKDYAFIGAGAYILKGVTVGKASVIGACAVVTKDVPDYEIWAGNPARKIGVVDKLEEINI